MQEDLGRDLEDGKLALPIDSSFDIEDVNDALARMKMAMDALWWAGAPQCACFFSVPTNHLGQ